MDESSIIIAHEELKKWERRHSSLKKKLEGLSRAERRERRDELKRIQSQIIYYQNLLQEMKKEIKPPRTMQGLVGTGGRK